jgi:hypothetical protein
MLSSVAKKKEWQTLTLKHFEIQIKGCIPKISRQFQTLDIVIKIQEESIPAPLVSTSFSLGNNITGNNFTFPSSATTTGSAP